MSAMNADILSSADSDDSSDDAEESESDYEPGAVEGYLSGSDNDALSSQRGRSQTDVASEDDAIFDNGRKRQRPTCGKKGSKKIVGDDASNISWTDDMNSVLVRLAKKFECQKKTKGLTVAKKFESVATELSKHSNFNHCNLLLSAKKC
jgi:hypothetical protein